MWGGKCFSLCFVYFSFKTKKTWPRIIVLEFSLYCHEIVIDISQIVIFPNCTKLSRNCHEILLDFIWFFEIRCSPWTSKLILGPLERQLAVKKILVKMMVHIFHHGAKENATFDSKFDVLEFLVISNLHKKIWRDISKILDFFLLSNFWWSFLCFWFHWKKENDHQKLDNRKKSTILEISLRNFLCMLSISQNAGKLDLKFI